jgi:hypothetical protein
MEYFKLQELKYQLAGRKLIKPWVHEIIIL